MARMRKPEVTFADLEALQQAAIYPCGKLAYSLKAAKNAAMVRNALAHNPETVYVARCYDGCSRTVFHLTNIPPSGKKSKALNTPRHVRQPIRTPGKTPEQKARAARRRVRNAANRARRESVLARLPLATWQDDGGALHPSELDG